jgi:hypothetical protein
MPLTKLIGWPWFTKTKDHRTLWHEARLEHIRASRCGDTRAMGQARKTMRKYAHEALRMELGR